MDSLTEQLAGISLTTVLFLVTVLTAARGALFASRVAVLRVLAELLESVVLAVVIVFLLVRPFLVQSYYIPSASMHPTLWEGDHILVNKLSYRLSRPERGDILVFRAPPQAESDEKEFIKRLVGLPGDVVSAQAGYVTVGTDTYPRDSIRAYLCAHGVAPAGGDGDGPPLRLSSDAICLGGHHVTGAEFAQIVGKPGQRVYIHPGRILINGQMLLEDYVSEDPDYDLPAILVPKGGYFVLGDNRHDSDDSHRWGILVGDRVIGRADCVFWPLDRVRRLR